ncbi:MAG: hypothetical protein KDC83_11415 [Flavobacteriales bacterium]|nr:hypothetical protein [Flavobacteriales bacterium]
MKENITLSVHKYYRINDQKPNLENTKNEKGNDDINAFRLATMSDMYEVKINAVIKNERFELELVGNKTQKDRIDKTAEQLIKSLKDLSKTR